MLSFKQFISDNYASDLTGHCASDLKEGYNIGRLKLAGRQVFKRRENPKTLNKTKKDSVENPMYTNPGNMTQHFNDIPYDHKHFDDNTTTKQIPLKHIKSAQETISPTVVTDRMKKISKTGEQTKPLRAYKKGNDYWLLDDNHEASALKLMGHKMANVKVKEID